MLRQVQVKRAGLPVTIHTRNDAVFLKLCLMRGDIHTFKNRVNCRVGVIAKIRAGCLKCE